jgi:hypothetical protein
LNDDVFMPISRFFSMSRDERLLATFSQGRPPSGQHLTLLCEDQNGKYKLPFRCEWRDDAWYHVDKSEPLQVKVIGWRLYTPSDVIEPNSSKMK